VRRFRNVLPIIEKARPFLGFGTIGVTNGSIWEIIEDIFEYGFVGRG